MFVCFLLKRTTRCMVNTQKSIASGYTCYWRLLTIKKRIVREEHNLPVVPHPPKCPGLFPWQWSWESRAISSKQCPWFRTFFEFWWCLCGSSWEWTYFSSTERTSQMALEVRHWDVLHSRNDAWMPLWRSRWKNYYSSSNNSAKESFN